ncbi:MAG: type II secretion system protein [Desulfobacteraceae bacterium]|nr:type II secretion system protein [Desulfobacteraceae bacterium]
MTGFPGKIKSDGGFTLIEVISVLLLVGILASLAGLGIVQVTKSFLFARNTNEMGQKNVLPMTRLRRSLANLTAVQAATSSSITLDLLQNGKDTRETYSWGGSGNPLTLTLAGTNPPAYALVDNVRDFSLEYTTQAGNTWSLGDKLSTLAHIGINLTLAGGDGSQEMKFSEGVVPRNTFIPTDTTGFPQGGTASEYPALCFIKSKLYRDKNPDILDLYRKVRQKLFSAGTFGEKIVSGYYDLSRSLCRVSDSHPVIFWILKTIFLFLTGFVFLIFYFPLAFPAFFLAAWLVFRVKQKCSVKPLKILNNERGSILIGVIITMVIMAALSGAMLSMFSSASIGSVSPRISQQAYYLAESGLGYAAQRYLLNNGTDADFIQSLNTTGSFPLVPGGTDSFSLDIQSFWFNNVTSGSSTTLSVSAFGLLPDAVVAGLSGFIQIPVSGGTSIVSYTDTDTNTDTDTDFQFVLSTASTYTAGNVFPACQPGTQTLGANELGRDPDLVKNYLSVAAADDLALFPDVNGIINFTDPDGNAHLLIYRRKSGTQLQGLQYPQGIIFPSAGVDINADTFVVLGKHAIIKSTGTSGTGDFTATQTITLHQPLSSVELFSKVEGGGQL